MKHPKPIYNVLIVLLTTLFFSCKEKNNVVIINEDTVLADTTYSKTPDAPVTRKVLVEEFTGATCTNCPDARQQLKAISDANPGRIVLIELHTANHIKGEPVKYISKYDLRSADAANIFKSIFRGYFPFGSIPNAAIDRVVDGGEILMMRTNWASIINKRIATESPIKLTLTNTYDAAKATGIVKVNVSYTKQISTKNYISIAMIENNIIDAQEFLDHIDTFYSFQHVFRKSFTPASGAEILSTIATKEPGRVYEGSFKYTIDPAWNPENCKIVVWVHNNDASTKEVLQAEEIHVKNP